jgi:hypothetical protein
MGVLLGEKTPSADDCALLVPARQTRNQARRLQLRIRVIDGRRHTRFQCEKGVATRRVGLRMSPSPVLRLNLGPPRQSEGNQSDDEAANLLRELRRKFSLRLVPASAMRHRNGLKRHCDQPLQRVLLSERSINNREGRPASIAPSTRH